MSSISFLYKSGQDDRIPAESVGVIDLTASGAKVVIERKFSFAIQAFVSVQIFGKPGY